MKLIMKKVRIIIILTVTLALYSPFSSLASSYDDYREWQEYESEIKSGLKGHKICRWVNKNGAWYYIGDLGHVSTGWFHVYFYYDENKNIVNDGNTYYSDKKGRMQTGWIQDELDGNWYYLGDDGRLWKNTTTPDGYLVDGQGRRIDSENNNASVRFQPIEIVSTFVSTNSVGGVSPYIFWQNTSNKSIKYIYFTMTPYNRVGDVQSCDIRGYVSFTGYVTGPIEPQGDIGEKSCKGPGHSGPVPRDTLGRAVFSDRNGGYRELTNEEIVKTYSESSAWDCAWYNFDISSIELNRIVIEYMDGTSETVTPNSVMRIVTPS